MQSIEEIREFVSSDLWDSLKSSNYKEDNNRYLSNSFIKKVKDLMNQRKNDSASEIEHVDRLAMQIFGDIFNVYQAYLLSVVKLKKDTNNRKANKNGKDVKAGVWAVSDGRLRFDVGFFNDKNVAFFVSDVEREVNQALSTFGESKNNKIEKGEEVKENNKLKSIMVFDYFVKQVAIFLRDFSSSENRLVLNIYDVILLIHDFLDPSCYVDASEWLEKQINDNESEDRIFDFDTPNNSSRVSWNSFCELMDKFGKKREFRMPLTSFSKFIKEDNDDPWNLDISKFKFLLNDYVYHTVVSNKSIFKATKRYENKWLLSGISELKQNRINFVKQIFGSNCSFNIGSTDELQDVIDFALSYLNPRHEECKGEKLISAISDLKNNSSESHTYSVLCVLFKKVNFAFESEQKDANIDQQFIKSLKAVGGYEVLSAFVNKSGFEFKEKTPDNTVVPLGARSTDLVKEIMPQEDKNGLTNTIKSKFNQFTNLFNSKHSKQRKQKKLTLQSQKNFYRDIAENIPKMIEEIFNKFESMIQNTQETQSLDGWNEFVDTLDAFYKNNFEPVYFDSHGSGPNINYDVFMKLVKIALYCNRKLCLSSSMEKSEKIIAPMKRINLVNMSILQQQRVNLSVKLNDINKKDKQTDEILENQIEFKDSLLLYIYANCLNQNKNCLLENTNEIIPIDDLSRYWLSKSLFDKAFDLKYIASYIGVMENIDVGEIYCHIIEFLNSAYSCKHSENFFDNKRRIIIENKDLINTIIDALEYCIRANNVVDENKSLSVDSVLEFCFRGFLLSKDQNTKDKIALSNNIYNFYIRILNLLDDNNPSFQESDLAMELVYKIEICLYNFISESGFECIDVFTPVFCKIDAIKQNIKNRIAKVEVDLPTQEEIEKAQETTKNDLQQNGEINNYVVDNVNLPENLNHAASDGNANIADVQPQQDVVSPVDKLKDDRNKAYLNMIQKFCDEENVFKKFIEDPEKKAEKSLGVALKLCSELDKNIIITEHIINEFISLFLLPREDQSDETYVQKIRNLFGNFIGKLIVRDKVSEKEQCENAKVMTQYFINNYFYTLIWKDYFKNELTSEISKRGHIIKCNNDDGQNANKSYSVVLGNIFSRNSIDDSDNKECISSSDFVKVYNVIMESPQTYEDCISLFNQAPSMGPESVKNMSKLVFFDFRCSEQLRNFFGVVSNIYQSGNQNLPYPSNFSMSMDRFFPIIRSIIIDCYDNYPNLVCDIFSLDIFENNSLSIDNLEIICDLVEIKRQNEHCLIQTNQNSASFFDNVMKLSCLRINNSDTLRSKLSLRTFVRCLKLSGDRTVIQSRFDWAIAEYNLVFDCCEFLNIVFSEPNISYRSFSRYCSFSFPHLSSVFYDVGENINPYADNNCSDIENPFLPLGTEINEAQENGLSNSKFVLKDKLELLDLLWRNWHKRTLAEINNNFANVDVRELSSCYMYYLNFVLYYAGKFMFSCKDSTEDIKEIVIFVQKVIGVFVNEDAQQILNHCEQPTSNISSSEKLDFILNVMGIVGQYNNFFAGYSFSGNNICLDVSKLIKMMSTLIQSIQDSWKSKLEKCFEWLNVMMIPNSLTAENIIEIMKLLLSEDKNDNPDFDADNIGDILFGLLSKLIDLARSEFKLNVVIDFFDYSEKYCSSDLVEQLLQKLQGQEFGIDTVGQLISKLDKSKLENVTIAKYILDMANINNKLRIFDKLLEKAQTLSIPLYKSFADLLRTLTYPRSAAIYFDIICSLFGKFSGDSDTPKESLIDLCLLVPRQDIKNVNDVLHYIQTFLKTSGLKFDADHFYKLVRLLFTDRSFCIDYQNMVDVISVLEKKQNVSDECLIDILKHCSAESDKNYQNNLFLSLVNFGDNALKTQRSDVVELLCKITEATGKPFEINVVNTNLQTNLQIMKIMANNNQALKNKQKTNVEILSSVLDCLVEKEIALSLGQLEYIFSYYLDNDTANNREFSIKLPLSLSNNSHQDLLNKFISILKPDENNFAHKFNQEQKNNKSARNNCAITLESFFKKYFGVEKLPKTEVLDVIKKVDFSKVKKTNEPIKKLITELWNFSEPFETGEFKKALSIEKSISDKVEWDKIDKDLGNIYFNEQIRSICKQVNNRNLNLCKEDYIAIQSKLDSLKKYFRLSCDNPKTIYKLDKENEKSETAKELFRFVDDSTDRNTDVTEVMLYLYLTHKKIQMQDKSNSEISDIIREVIDFGFIANTENKIGYFENILDNLLIDENNQIQKISFNGSDSVFYLIMEGLENNSVRYRDLVEFVGRYFSKQEIQNNIVICLFKQSWKYIKRAFSNESAADDKVLQIDDFENKDRLKDISFDQNDVLLMSKKIKSRFLDFTTENNKKAAERFLSNCCFDHNDDKRFPSDNINTILEKCEFRNFDVLINFFNLYWNADMLPAKEQVVAWIRSAGLSDKNQEEINKFWRHTQKLYLLSEIYKLSNGNVENDFYNPDFKGKFEECGKIANGLMSGGINPRDAEELYNQIGYKYKDANHEASVTLLFNAMLLPYEIWVLNFVLFSASNLLLVLLVIAGVMGTILLNALTVFVLCLNLVLSAYFGIKTGKAVSFNCKKVIFEPEKTWFQNLCTKLLRGIFYKPNFNRENFSVPGYTAQLNCECQIANRQHEFEVPVIEMNVKYSSINEQVK